MDTMEIFQSEFDDVSVHIKTEPVSDHNGDFDQEVQLTELEIKSEPHDERDAVFVDVSPETYMNPADVKIEPADHQEVVVPTQEREQFAFKCRICGEVFTSRYAFTIHVNKHEKKCVNCKVEYKTWKDFGNHEPFCARRFGRKIIVPRVSRRNEKVKKFDHKCSLCDRRYEKYDQLFQHQVQRCTKRYISKKWVVKI